MASFKFAVRFALGIIMIGAKHTVIKRTRQPGIGYIQISQSFIHTLSSASNKPQIEDETIQNYRCRFGSMDVRFSWSGFNICPPIGRKVSK